MDTGQAVRTIHPGLEGWAVLHLRRSSWQTLLTWDRPADKPQTLETLTVPTPEAGPQPSGSRSIKRRAFEASPAAAARGCRGSMGRSRPGGRPEPGKLDYYPERDSAVHPRLDHGRPVSLSLLSASGAGRWRRPRCSWLLLRGASQAKALRHYEACKEQSAEFWQGATHEHALLSRETRVSRLAGQQSQPYSGAEVRAAARCSQRPVACGCSEGRTSLVSRLPPAQWPSC